MLDLSQNVGGDFCARLIADFGGDVIKIEPPGGTPIRREGPFLRGVPGPEHSLLFWHLNTGKRSAVINTSDDDGFRLLQRLAEEADLVIAEDGVDCDALRHVNPALVTCQLNGFGTSGPMADWQGSELIYQAFGGSMYATGSPEREPIYGPGRIAHYMAGTYLYIAALAALHERPAMHTGQHVEVAIVEAVTASLMNFTTMHEYNGYVHGRQGSGNPLALLQTKDGWVVLYLYSQWAELCDILGAHDLAVDDRFRDSKDRLANWPTARELLRPYFLRWEAGELVRKAQDRHITMTKVMTPADLLHAEHLLARNFWETVDTGEGHLVFVGAPFRMQLTPRAALRRPPRIGEHSRQVLGNLGLPPEDLRCLAGLGVIG